MAQIEKHVHQHAASSTSEGALLEEAMKQFKTNTFRFHVNLFNFQPRFMFLSFPLTSTTIFVGIDITINPGIS